MVCFFPHDLIHVYGYSESMEYNTRTGELVAGYEYKFSIMGDFQLTGNKDVFDEEGKLLEDTYKLFVDNKVIFDSKDLFMYDGVVYEIIGSPTLKHHLLPHNYIRLVRYRKELKGLKKPSGVVVR